MSKKVNSEGNYPVKYEMRAPPRRRIKGEDMEDQPVFLRKAYVMMSSCPPEIGGWSEKGDTVVIRDAKQFAEKIIPTAYKHNNFSSFVRQLNFYGFRKIKSESIDQATWWEFRHPQFLRDQPHLLSEIKRSVHYVNNDSNNVHEVSDLKSQVGCLTDRIEALHEQIEMLTGAVNHMQLNGAFSEAPLSLLTDSAGNKKRKVVAKVQFRNRSVTEGAESSGTSSPELVRMSSLGSAMDFLDLEGAALPTGPELQSMDLFPAVDEETWDRDIDQLLLAQELDSPLPYKGEKLSSAAYALPLDDAHLLPRASVVSASNVHAAPAPAMQDLFSVLEGLSPELKVRFVDKLAEVMGRQLTQNLGATNNNSNASAAQYTPSYAASSSSSSAMQSVPLRRSESGVGQSFAQLTSGANAPYRLPSGVQAPEIALPLASAALGAFVISSLNSLALQQQHASAVRIKTEVV